MKFQLSLVIIMPIVKRIAISPSRLDKMVIIPDEADEKF
jgi:hypothetical protein